jgi:hypothetical protein
MRRSADVLWRYFVVGAAGVPRLSLFARSLL